MAKGLRIFLTAIILVGLFAIALITGGETLLQLNNPNKTLGADPALNSYINQLNQTLATSLDNSNAAETAIGESPPTVTTTGIIIEAVSNVWKTLKAVPITVYNLTLGLLFSKLLGSPRFALVTVVITAVFVMALIFYVVKWVFSGDGG